MMLRPFAFLLLLGWSLTPLAAQEVKPQQSLRDYAVKSQGRSAFGLYVKGKKVGWEVEEFKLGKHDGREVAVQTAHMHIVQSVLGRKSVMEEKTTTCYELTGEGRIVYAEVRQTDDKVETVRTAVRKGDGMLLTTRTGKRTTERKIPVPRETLALQRRFERWLQGPPKKGESFENYTTSLDEDNIDTKVVCTFKEKKSIVWGGVPMDVYAVRNAMQGIKTDEELRADGKPVVGRLASLLEIRLEKEALAKQIDGGPVDVEAASAIPVDRRLGDANKVERLALRVTGLDDFDLPRSHRQRLVRGKDGDLIELSRDFPVKEALPLTAEERKKFLRATATVQSDHESIRALAHKVVGDETDPVRAAGLLEKWVFKNVRKTYSANADNALTVLDNRAGDCTEHTLLFVALARAAGVPARVVGGVAYADGKRPVFAWHAWAEVHDGRQWVSVDATWDEVFVDATHVKFSEGSEDYAWLNVAGKLKMKVVEVKKRK